VLGRPLSTEARGSYRDVGVTSPGIGGPSGEAPKREFAAIHTVRRRRGYRDWPNASVSVWGPFFFREINTAVIPGVAVAAALGFKTSKRRLRSVARGVFEKRATGGVGAILTPLNERRKG